jgi:hypothetical protein
MSAVRTPTAGASAAQVRPWYREPWVWVLIAFPLAAVVGCAITIWLALRHPDYLVVDEQEYQQIEAGLEAARAAATPVSPEPGHPANADSTPAQPTGRKHHLDDGDG